MRIKKILACTAIMAVAAQATLLSVGAEGGTQTTVTTVAETTVTTLAETTATTVVDETDATTTTSKVAPTSFAKTKDVKAGVLELEVEIPTYATTNMTINPYYQDGDKWSWNAADLYKSFSGEKTITLTWDLSEIATATDESPVGKIGFQLGGCPTAAEVFNVNVIKAAIKVGEKEYSLIDLVGTKQAVATATQWGNNANVEIEQVAGLFNTVLLGGETTTVSTTTTAAATTVTTAAATTVATTTTTKAATTTAKAAATSPKTGDKGIAVAVASVLAAAGVAIAFKKKK